MADTAVATDTPAPTTPAKKIKSTAGGAGAKKPKAKPTHPKTSDMVNNAIKELKERSGSSLQAIKKYISAQYNVDAEKLAPFIRKYLKNAVESGALIQTKGKGASGSFKLESKSTTAAKKPSTAKKPTGGKARKSPAASKSKKATTSSPSKPKPTTKDKKAAAAKRKPTPKKAPTPAKGKSGGATPKAKKSAKPPTKKPKAPKPKKATTTPKSKSTTKKSTAKK